ncbi:hypothetical protein LX36DRAFT_664801 [Colletotrichum falcatum]|nr:hypothetical protein LX36DRAFT_664801 [Colletotrichum falcatum]
MARKHWNSPDRAPRHAPSLGPPKEVTLSCVFAGELPVHCPRSSSRSLVSLSAWVGVGVGVGVVRRLSQAWKQTAGESNLGRTSTYQVRSYDVL